MVLNFKFLVPLYPAGQEPPPDGVTSPDEIAAWEQTKKMEKYMSMGSESCVFKSVLAGGLGLYLFRVLKGLLAKEKLHVEGFGMGAFFSMMSASFAYEDPLARTDLSTRKKTVEMFKDMGKGMWRSGRSFGKVGALYSGVECVVESVCRS
jgi:mitochondrial import inner membrane translocase subunit TIM22